MIFFLQKLCPILSELLKDKANYGPCTEAETT